MAQLHDFMLEHFMDDKELFVSIQQLEIRVGRKLFKKIQNDKDEVNFYSWLTEMRWGLFFSDFVQELKYDQRIDGKTPDWTITLNEQKIITESLRLNNTPDDELREKIKHIHECKKYNRENPGQYRWPATETKWLSSQYYYGCQDRLVQKEKKYREIINRHKTPFIICAAPILETFIGGLDTFDFLIGNTRKGFFYTDENFGRNVTGVLLRTFFGQNLYFHNEIAENKLNEENLKFFSSMAYKED